MKCYNCGKTIEDGIAVCPYCKQEQGISRELSEAAKSMDQQACRELYNLCYPNVYYTAKSMIGDEDIIQDIVRDTFIQAFRSLDWMDYMEGRFQAWIRRIAHNTTVSYIKKKKPVLFSEMETDHEESGIDFWDERQEHLPEVVIDRNETARLIREILDVLSEEQRLAVGMYYYEQKSVWEISQTMGISEGTVKNRLNHARRKIQEKVLELEEEGTKLYELSPIPFLMLLFRNQGMQTSETPNAHTFQLIQQALSAIEKNSVAMGNIGTVEGNISAAVTGQFTDAELEETEEIEEIEETAGQVSAAVSKGSGRKIAICAVVLILAVGGIVYSITGRSSDDKTTVRLTAEEDEDETETEMETESESEAVIVAESAELHAMIADVPDWEAEELTVLGNDSLLRSEITSITFLSSADGLTGYTENMVWDVSEERDGSVMAYAVENAEADYALYIVSDYGVYANADCSYMFAYYSSAASISFNGLFNTEQVTDMSGLFSEDDSLEQVDLTAFDTSNVTDMNNMFYGCTRLQEVDVSLWNTAAVTDMSYMFQECASLAELNLSGFNTMGVENMSYMFEGCNALSTLDLSSFQTAGVLDMSYMFEGCYALVTLDVSSFDTVNVTDMSYMFEGCEMLESLDLSSFDTSQVMSMSAMFEACASLTSLDVSNFDTGNVEFMENMFSGCVSLTSLDVSSFRTGNVGNMNSMFSDCESLTSLDVSNFDTSNVGDMSKMFYNCSSLSIDLSSFDMSNVSNVEDMTEGCMSVTGLAI